MVDDDDAMLFAFRKLCAVSGVSAECADSLESALWHLSHECFDILISDLSLTGASGQEGLEIVRTAKSKNPLVHAYIWTAYDEKTVHEKAVETGIEGFLAKPVKLETLLALINDCSPVSA